MNKLILRTDSYKASHWLQYKPGTTMTYSYIESRGGKYASTVFFGLQYYLQEYLSKPITHADIAEAKAFFEAHGEPFNEAGWVHILNKHGGFLPLEIRAVPEGTVVPNHNVLVTVESTDPECYWLTSYMETLLLKIWYPITVATQSWTIKKIIKRYLDETSDNAAAELPFKLHDFGSRGVSSCESAGIGGAAHLVNFMGSDTVEGVYLMNKFYNKGAMSAFSIPAAEHSTITSWGRDGELDAYRNMLNQYARPGSILAVVSDSYDIKNAIKKFWCGELKDDVITSGATVVIRPDSGDPVTMINSAINDLAEGFGTYYNTKGYRVLNHNVRLIQGDGINEDSIQNILAMLKTNNFSASNIAFGMGGALLQQVNRDTQKFAYKCSLATINGESVEIYKDPITDPGKASKKGRLDCVDRVGGLVTLPGELNAGSIMKVVFKDGQIMKTYTLDEVRRNSELTGR